MPGRCRTSLPRESQARRYLKEAQLRIGQACLEDLDYAPRRELDRAADPTTRHRPLDPRAPQRPHHRQTGVGKTYVACALGQLACRHGYRAVYRDCPGLFQELALARADGSYPTLLARLARVDCLIIDDWGLGTLTEMQRHDLLEVIEDRDAARSTVIASQLAPRRLARLPRRAHDRGAVLDRLVHNAYTMTLKGPPDGRRSRQDHRPVTDRRPRRFAPITMAWTG